MLIDTLRKTFMIGLILAMALAEDLCNVARYIFTKPTATSGDGRGDSAGDIPQH